MTTNTLERLARSIAYRRRLKEELPGLEADLATFMQSENLGQITAGGYRVKLNGGDIHSGGYRFESGPLHHPIALSLRALPNPSSFSSVPEWGFLGKTKLRVRFIEYYFYCFSPARPSL